MESLQYFKKVRENLNKPLSIMWRESLRTVVFPTPLKVGSIFPIYKGGDPSKPKKYRPVTLMSDAIKIFEKVVVKYLSNYLENNSLYDDQ